MGSPSLPNSLKSKLKNIPSRMKLLNVVLVAAMSASPLMPYDAPDSVTYEIDDSLGNGELSRTKRVRCSNSHCYTCYRVYIKDATGEKLSCRCVPNGNCRY